MAAASTTGSGSPTQPLSPSNGAEQSSEDRGSTTPPTKSEQSTQIVSLKVSSPTETPKVKPSSRGFVSDPEESKSPEVEDSTSMQLNEQISTLRQESSPTTTSTTESLALANPRGQWVNQFECILSVLGVMIGYGNIWRFPQLAADGGGGAFIIPYFIVLVVAGVPLVYLEMCLGQYASFGPTGVFDNVAPFFQGLGWAVNVTVLIITIYYNCLTAWSFFYLFASFQRTLPWGSCEHDWNSIHCFSQSDNNRCIRENGPNSFFYNHSCHSVNDSNAMQLYTAERDHHTLRSPAIEYFYNNLYQQYSDGPYMGSLQWHLILCLLLSWFLTLLCVFRGVRSMGLAVYFTTLFPFVSLIVLVILALNTEGAGDGISFYFTFSFSSLGNIHVWTKAAVQVLYSLSIAQGTLIALASFNQFKNNCFRDALITCSVDTVTSAVAGFAIFPALGYLAKIDNVHVKDVIGGTNSTALIFVIVSRSIGHLPAAPAWSVVLFSTFVVVGLSSVFIVVEGLVTVLCDQFPILLRRRSLVAAGLCAFLFLLGLPICSQRGYQLFTTYDKYIGIPIIFNGLLQLVCVIYVHGPNRFLSTISIMFRRCRSMISNFFGPTGNYWFLTWTFCCPIILFIVFILEMVPNYSSTMHSKWTNLFGWTIAFIPIFVVILVASGRLVRNYCIDEPIIRLFKPTTNWCPLHDRLLQYHGEIENRTATLDLRTTSIDHCDSQSAMIRN